MAKRYIEINKILNFSETILNKKNLNYKDFVFNHKDQCLRKILVLTNFKDSTVGEYINSAYNKGIRGLILDRKVSKSIIPEKIPVCYSKYLSSNLNLFLSEIYNDPLKGKKIIGVTGTDGKTSLVHLLAQAYTAVGKKVGIVSTEGNGIYPRLYKSEYTTPRNDILFKYFNIFKNESVNLIIIESSSQGLDQGRLNHIKFDTSIITNITKDHLDYHKNYSSYIRSKCKLLDMTHKKIFLNIDCKNSNRLINITSSDAKVEYFNSKYKISSKHKTLLINNSANKYNFSVTYSLLKQMRITDKKIIRIFSKIVPIPGRNNIIRKRGFAHFIIDYAHTKDSLEALLIDIREIFSLHANKLIIVFGCGGDRDKRKRLEMGKVASSLCDIIILSDDNPRSEKSTKIINEINEGISESKKVYKIANRRNAIKKSIKLSNPGDIVVIAGKGNEETIDYGRKTIIHNDIECVKKLINEN
ncbi:MAG: hypothetical protein CMD73_01680 [Gammaproteobacteria bacterium]|nr:hypothetical protein [Gammaproteobacteria bacterium]